MYYYFYSILYVICYMYIKLFEKIMIDYGCVCIWYVYDIE